MKREDCPQCHGTGISQKHRSGRERANTIYGKRKVTEPETGEKLWGVEEMGDGTWICMECGCVFDDDLNIHAPMAAYSGSPLWRHTKGHTRKRGCHD